jgi:hypothetical protein
MTPSVKVAVIQLLRSCMRRKSRLSGLCQSQAKGREVCRVWDLKIGTRKDRQSCGEKGMYRAEPRFIPGNKDVASCRTCRPMSEHVLRWNASSNSSPLPFQSANGLIDSEKRKIKGDV